MYIYTRQITDVDRQYVETLETIQPEKDVIIMCDVLFEQMRSACMMLYIKSSSCHIYTTFIMQYITVWLIQFIVQLILSINTQKKYIIIHLKLIYYYYYIVWISLWNAKVQQQMAILWRNQCCSSPSCRCRHFYFPSLYILSISIYIAAADTQSNTQQHNNLVTYGYVLIVLATGMQVIFLNFWILYIVIGNTI